MAPQTPTTPQTPQDSCEGAIRSGLAACTAAVSDAILACFQSGATSCNSLPPGGANAALSTLASDVSGACEASDLTALGYNLPVGELEAEFADLCLGASTTLGARLFGGPTGAVLNSAAVQSAPADSSCLETAYDQAADFAAAAISEMQSCISDGDCGDAAAAIADLQAAAVTAVNDGCTATDLRDLSGLSPATLMDRTLGDAECQVAATNPGQSILDLSCAPDLTVPATQGFVNNGGTSAEIFSSTATTDGEPSVTRDHPLERGQFVQVELDGATTGAVCGDGSNYRFWIQLADAGTDVRNVISFMQGGGVCTSAADCESAIVNAISIANGAGGSSRIVNSGASAIGSNLGSSRLMSNTNPENPYRTWTKVFLPYCTQDIHVGGPGGSETFTVNVPGTGNVDYEIHRTGSHNIRTALNVTRNAIWATLNAEGIGYDPAEINAVFAGSSAGGFGATFNYHFALDELRWTNTAMGHLWGLGVDDPATSRVFLRALTATKRDLWNTPPSLAPYCQADECIHTEFQTARALERADPTLFPRQQYLIVSAQADPTQANTTGITDNASKLTVWGNALRDTYCRMRDASIIPNQSLLHFYLPKVVGHGLSADVPFAPSNQTIHQWFADFEAGLDVDDNVFSADGELTLSGGGTITLDDFSCL